MNLLNKDQGSDESSPLNKLIVAFNTNNYLSLTLEDLSILVKQRILSPDTAIKLVKECSYVS